MKKIRLKNSPSSLPVPSVADALNIVPWLDGDQNAQDFVRNNGN